MEKFICRKCDADWPLVEEDRLALEHFIIPILGFCKQGGHMAYIQKQKAELENA